MKRFFSNPFMLKELRQLTRSRMVVLSLLVYLGAEVIALWMLPASGISCVTGRELFGLLTFIYFVAAGIMVPLNVFVRTCHERGSAGTPSDLVLSTTLTPTQVVDGKILSAAALSLMFATALLPFGVASYLLHGLYLSTAFGQTLTLFVLSLMLTTLLLFIATLRASRLFRYLLAMMVAVIFFGVFPATGSPTRGGFGFDVTLCAVLLSVAAVLRATAVECLAPTASERSRCLRVTALVVSVGWLVWAWAAGELRDCCHGLSFLGYWLLVLASAQGYGYSRRQLAERRCWIFATGALNGMVFAIVLGLLFAALSRSTSCFCAFAYYSASVLCCRFVWRQVCRFKPLPAGLVPLYGAMLCGVVGFTAVQYLSGMYGLDLNLNRKPLAVAALGLAILLNLPAVVKMLRLRFGGSPKESRTPLPSMKSSCPSR